ACAAAEAAQEDAPHMSTLAKVDWFAAPAVALALGSKEVRASASRELLKAKLRCSTRQTRTWLASSSNKHCICTWESSAPDTCASFARASWERQRCWRSNAAVGHSPSPPVHLD